VPVQGASCPDKEIAHLRLETVAGEKVRHYALRESRQLSCFDGSQERLERPAKGTCHRVERYEVKFVVLRSI
jgi:hypothetical protein